MGKLCRCNPCGARRTGPAGGPGAGGWGPGGVVGTYLEIKNPEPGVDLGASSENFSIRARMEKEI